MNKQKNNLGFIAAFLVTIAFVACGNGNGVVSDNHDSEIGKDVDYGDSFDCTDCLIGPPVNTISEEKCVRMYRTYSGDGYLMGLLDSEKAAEVNCCMDKIRKRDEDLRNHGYDIDAIEKISFNECFVSGNGAEDNFTLSGENGLTSQRKMELLRKSMSKV